MPGAQRSVTLRFLAAPSDAGVTGLVGAGKGLEWIDKAGYATAVAWTGRSCVTAYVGNIHFTRPVQVGDLVEVQGRVVHTGRTSLWVVCTVSSGDPRSGGLRVNTQCVLQFVAMGEDGLPTPVPEFVPADDWERGEHARAELLKDVRRAIEAEMAERVYSEHTQACRETLRFLAAPSDVNWGGKVHGGYVMDWIHQAANLVAERWHGGAAVAVYAGGVRFYHPMFIGDLVEVEARLIYTGFSSLHVSVHVRSGNPRTAELTTTTHCTMVYVALNAAGRKVPVRSWNPHLPEDRDLQDHAKQMISIRERLLRTVPTDAPPSPWGSPPAS